MATKWQIKNPERNKANKRAYYLRNREKEISVSKLRYQNNREAAFEAAKRWKEKNPELRKKADREYYARNVKKIQLKSRIYGKSHLAERRAYLNLKRKTDIQYKLRCVLRSRFAHALKGDFKPDSAIRVLGCTIPELKTHLENQFKPGMTWDNWGPKGWHVDHKKALANFDLTKREQLLEVCNYTNLQPMWWLENIRKSNGK